MWVCLRARLNLTWRNPPADHWYAAKSPGLSQMCRRYRALQMALVRFRRGHLRGITFMQGVYLSLLLLISFLISGAFPADGCLEIKTWFETFLCGKVKWTWCRLSGSKGI
ncbi:hypothetical protein TNCV_914251 [Trichonephila clavipes]|nr:hypothetical protein TNCV_914251 [Trichonephila clavipes]